MKKYIHKQSILERMRLFILTTFLLVVGHVAFAQLITNPGFEIRTSCPSQLGQVNLATGWSQPTGGTSDYYNTCGNQAGSQTTLTISPQSGAGLVGGYADNPGADYKEYVTNTLSAPLIAGVTYTVSFYMSNKINNGSGTSDMLPMTERGYMGLCFSTTAPTQANTTGSIGSIRNDFAPTGRTYIPANHPYYTSDNTWTPVTLKYTATGGERYMTVGQFRPGNSITQSGWFGNYFYVDSFSELAPNATLTKSVAPSSISSGGTATYTFTVNNTTLGNEALSGLKFTDALPSGLRIAATPNVVVTGLTGGTVTASAGGISVAASGYSIAANTTATITVNVTNAPGQLNASCGSNPAAFTNSATNISNLSANLTNNISPVCLVVTPACNAGTVAPAVQNISSTCPATTVNLNLAHTGSIPSGTNLVWFFNNNPHSGTALTAAQIANAGAGTYYAFYQSTTVADCFSPASNAVAVTITACNPPSISSILPITQNTCQGIAPSPITVSATGTGTLTYQWYFNTDGSTTTGTAISGATSATYTPLASSTIGTTYYAAVVTDANGSTRSSNATVTVVGRPATPVVSAITLSNVCPATSANLTTLQPAAVSGQTYEWHTSASNPNFGTLVASPNGVSAGTYYLFARDNTMGCYSVASNAVNVTINACPSPSISSITPAAQSVCQSVTPTAITVSATGAGTLTYQWYSNTDGSTTTGTAISGATSASYTPLASSTVGTTYYAAVVTNANGSARSSNATVSVTLRPSAPAVSVTTLSNACPATTANLTSLQPAAVSGQTYEWHTSASNPNSGTLVASPNVVSAGTYYLYSKATAGGCYSPASNAVTVTINTCPSPTISSITPAVQSACQGRTPTVITVSATGTGTLTYQWYSNTDGSTTTGTAISGATSASYTPPASSTVGTTYYAAVVTNANGSTRSSNATVSVTLIPSAPAVSATTLSNVCPATTANLISLQPAAIGGQTYEWHTSASNPNSGTLVASPNAVSAGTYYLYSKATTGGCYSTASNAVTVTINTCPSPSISSITPATQSVCQGASPATISVSATGTGTLTYQWYSNTDGSTITGTAISGATSASYTPLTSSTVGTTYYAAVVTNANGSTRSTNATVSITLRPSAPAVSATTLSNVCPATTANLTGLQPAAVGGQTYEWHTSASNPNSGTLVASPNAVSAGTYYLYSKAAAGGCYSPASNAVTVTINTCTPPPTCGASGNNFVNLNSTFTGTTPGAAVQLQWWKTANRTPGTQEMNPTNVTVSGTYYAFFYDTTNTCWNTVNSTAAVTVNILPLCSCTKPGDFSSAGSITKIGITVQQKQSGWPENVPNGFMALESKEKGFVITRVKNSGMITDPKMGMLIYDMDANCIKLYNGSAWKCISKSCNTP